MRTGLCRFLFFLCLLALVSWGTPVVNSGGTWNSVPQCVPPNCPVTSPYWVNVSQDDGIYSAAAGQSRTLLSVINGTSPYANMPAFTNAQWYGADGTNPASDLFFTGLTTYNVSLLLRETGNNLVFGWYSFDGTGVVGGGVLIDSSVAAGTQNITFTPTTANFGFYFKYGRPEDCATDDWRAVCSGTVLSHLGGTGVPMDIFYTQTSRNAGSANSPAGAPAGDYYEVDYQGYRQHFAALRTDQGLVVGVEDGWSTDRKLTTLNTPHGGPIYEGAGDFNDLVVVVTEVPEPATFVMLGAGLLGLALFGRKRLS